MALSRSLIGALANTTNGQRVAADLLLEQQRSKLVQGQVADEDTRRKAQELFGRSLQDLLGGGSPAMGMGAAPPMAPGTVPTSPAPGQPSVPMAPAGAAGAPMGAAGGAPGAASPMAAPPAGAAPVPQGMPAMSGQPFNAANIINALRQQAQARGTAPEVLGSAFQSIYPLYEREQNATAQREATSAYRMAQLQQQSDQLGMHILQMQMMSNDRSLTREQQASIAARTADLENRKLHLDEEVKAGIADDRRDNWALSRERLDLDRQLGEERNETARIRAENEGLRAAGSPTALKRADAVRQMQDTRARIRDTLTLLDQDPALAGTSGKARRGASSVMEQVGGAADRPANDFAANIQTIQNQVGGPLLNLRNWSGPAAARLKESVPGLGYFDNPAKVRAALTNIDSVLKTALDEEGRAGALEGAPLNSAPGAAAPAPGGNVPAKPPGVPDGSAYSPSRKQWRDPAGKIYDERGAPLGGAGVR